MTMPNEYTALDSIQAPGTMVFGYRRGDEVKADVVDSWGLEVGVHVKEGDLDAGETPAPMVRPGPEANRADWEAWAVANGMSAEDADTATMEDLQAIDVNSDPDRPADSARKAEWVDHAVSRGLDRDTAEGMTKAELQEWTPDEVPVGDTIAQQATEAQG
jgi:hypothetical protein